MLKMCTECVKCLLLGAKIIMGVNVFNLLDQPNAQ